MVVIDEIKTIFIHVQRTGGSTITRLFHRFYQYRMKIISQHGNYLSEDAQFIHQHPDYFVFGFVRNPWDRMLSWYSFLNQHSPKSIDEERKRFEHFLKEVIIQSKNDPSFHLNQLDYFPDSEQVENPIQLFFYENFEEEVQRMFAQFGLNLDKVERVNGTQTKNYRDYYTEKSKRMIQESCEKDIAYFKYQF